MEIQIDMLDEYFSKYPDLEADVQDLIELAACLPRDAFDSFYEEDSVIVESCKFLEGLNAAYRIWLELNNAWDDDLIFIEDDELSKEQVLDADEVAYQVFVRLSKSLDYAMSIKLEDIPLHASQKKCESFMKLMSLRLKNGT
jgi:hypothetical protein